MAAAPSPRRRAVVWAINELARRDHKLVGRLLTAFDHLKRAQTRQRRMEIREADAALRTAVDAAVDRAAAHLAERGGAVTLATRRRLDATLRGAAAGARRALSDGALTTELTAPGFEVFGDVHLKAVPAPRPARKAPPPAVDRTEAARELLHRRAEQLEQDATAHVAAARDAARAVEAARARLQELEGRARETRGRATRATRTAARARRSATRPTKRTR